MSPTKTTFAVSRPPAPPAEAGAPPALDLPPALLEDWMRDFYFEVDFDLGSSGVEDFTLGELRRQAGIELAELDGMVLRDSRTLGDPELRRALARRFLDGDPARVMVTHGSTEANFLVMNALLSAGDEVVVLEPIYQQLRGVAETLGCRLVPWPMRAENGFHPDVDEALRLIGSRTRMVVVNFPHNPTGATLSRDEQRALLDAAGRHGAWVVWDGAFSEITYGDPPLPEPVLESERAVSLGTLSKAYGLPGLRVGWLFAPPEVLERAVRLRDYLTLHLSPLVERFARAAIEAGDELVGRRRRQAAANLEVLAAWMEAHADVVRWVPPAGGVSTFPRFLGVDDTTGLCRSLAAERRVLLVPGACFGHPAHARLGFGGSAEGLRRGLELLSAHLRERRPAGGENSASCST